MAAKKKPIEEVKTEVKEEVVTPKARKPRTTSDVKELKKKIAELETANTKLAEECNNLYDLINSLKTQKQNMEMAMNKLISKYTHITEYVKRLTTVYHQSVFMAFEEDEKND